MRFGALLHSEPNGAPALHCTELLLLQARIEDLARATDIVPHWRVQLRLSTPAQLGTMLLVPRTRTARLL